jgi:hypothetical protein
MSNSMKSMNPNPHNIAASLALAARGWPVFPLRDGGTPDAKKPRKGSRGYMDATTEPETIKSMFAHYPNANIGVATGEESGFFVLDVDPRNGGDESLQALEAEYGPLPHTVRQNTGNGGEHIFFKCPKGITFKNQAGKLGPGLDIKTDGGYIVVEPSIHPNGRPYAFDVCHHPEEVEIAEAPQWLLNLLTQKKPKKPSFVVDSYHCKRTSGLGRTVLASEVEKIKNAPIGEQEVTLNNASLNIGGLVKDGHIKYNEAHEALVDAGLHMANDPTREPWTRAQIMSKVRRALSQANRRIRFISDNEEIEMEFEQQPHNENTLENEILTLPDAILSPPGIFGKYVKHLLNKAVFPEPLLAIAAAIALWGVIKAHKIQTMAKLRTNFFTLGIAPSGTGKDSARTVNQQTLDEIGMAELLGGSPASTTGMFTMIVEAGGKALAQIDEFGPFLATISGKNVSGCLKGMDALLMELFTSASKKFMGKQYANRDGNNPRQDIDQPNLCLYGTTTPLSFYAALTSRDAMSGFLPRMLIFEVKKPTLEKSSPDFDSPLPDDIKTELLKWKVQPTNVEPAGDLDFSIQPKKIAFEPEAQQLLDDYANEKRRQAFSNKHINTGRDAILNRLAEHAAKLALLVTDHDEKFLSLPSLQWGIDIAEYSAKLLFNALENHIADSAREANVKRVLNFIKEAPGGWISQSEVTRKTSFLNSRTERQEILDTLVEAGQIEAKEVGTKTKSKTLYRALNISKTD